MQHDADDRRKITITVKRNVLETIKDTQRDLLRHIKTTRDFSMGRMIDVLVESPKFAEIIRQYYLSEE